MPAEYQIVGLSKFISTMRRAGIDMQDFKDANSRAGAIIVGRANALAPRRSGALAGTIRSARQARKVVVMAGNASVPYAGPIHWGWTTRGIEAQPFLSNAATQSESSWLPGYLKELETIIGKVRGA